LTSSFQPHYGCGVDTASDRNEYQQYFLEGNDKLTSFMCRLSSELEALTSWHPHGLSRSLQGLFYLYLLRPYLTICTQSD